MKGNKVSENKLRESIAFLNDDSLIWSDDFETIRKSLAALLQDLDTHCWQSHELESFVDALLQTEITQIDLEDPLMQWIDSASRQLGIVEYTASKSERMTAALKRLFRVI
jgi:hypothetical protein